MRYTNYKLQCTDDTKRMGNSIPDAANLASGSYTYNPSNSEVRFTDCAQEHIVRSHGTLRDVPVRHCSKQKTPLATLIRV